MVFVGEGNRFIKDKMKRVMVILKIKDKRYFCNKGIVINSIMALFSLSTGILR